MLSSVVWVPHGKAKEEPVLFEPSAEELQEEADLQEEGEEGDIEEADEEGEDQDEGDNEDMEDAGLPQLPDRRNDESLAEYNMQDYDKEDSTPGQLMTGAGMKGLMYYENNEKDPYVVMDDSGGESDDDLRVRDTDRLIVCAKVEEEVSSLEVHLCESPDNVYVHHEILLPAFPLCLSWLDFNCDPHHLGAAGNFVAVGTFHPGIELWDMDLIDAPVPVATLGGHVAPQPGEGNDDNNNAPQTKKEKKKAKKKAKRKTKATTPLKPDSHTDAVMAVMWNPLQRNLVVSGSADTTVKLWDLAKCACALTFTEHSNKVQNTVWHPTQASVVATASYDRSVKVFDVRNAAAVSSWGISGDAESLAWNPANMNHLFASAEDGSVVCIDVRNPAKPVFTLQAHNKSTNALAFSPTLPNLLCTGSVEKCVKLWDVSGNKPVLVDTLVEDLGTVFALSFCADAPGALMACGGGKGKLRVVDWLARDKVQRHMHARAGRAE